MSPHDKIKLVFFGTPDFAVPALLALAKLPMVDVVFAVTRPDKPRGRHRSVSVPSSVKTAAKSLKIEVLEDLKGLKDKKADLGVVAAFGAILPDWVLEHFPLGVLNIHPSLLPLYRGPSPIQAAILNQDTKTGVTIIKLDDKMDHGPILAQEAIKISPSLTPAGDRLLTAGALHDILAKRGAQLLVKTLPGYIAGEIISVPQDDSQATYTKKLTKDDGRIDWSNQSSEIEAQVRAMNPWPGAWTIWRGKRLIIWQAVAKSLINSGNRGLALELEEVQPEGKKKISFAEFKKGYQNFSLEDCE